MNKKLYVKIGIVAAMLAGILIVVKFYPIWVQENNEENSIDSDESVPPPAPVAVNQDELLNQPKNTSALGGYNVLIADRGNNRLIEVNPAKQIVWEYKFNLPTLGLGADDGFFTDNGKSIIVNLEGYNTIQIIDYQSKQITWEYGVKNKAGHTAGLLHTPDDAYKLPNGNIVVADIKNCRVLEISPDKQIVHQYGKTLQCSNKVGYLNMPNGDTPLPNGHILISNIVGHSLVEIDSNWQPVFSMSLPVVYPSDPQPTQAGNILISDYSKPGQIVEVSKQGKIIWRYGGDVTTKLNKPSLAIELPNGNILSNDDFNHRVIVIDKKTKQIVWQYGVTGKPGIGPGQLNIPDGLDIIKRPPSTSAALLSQSIGSVTRNANNFIDQNIMVQGYLLKKENGYVIFSDEVNGTLGYYDLPVSGPGLSTIKSGQKYILSGKFVKTTTIKTVNGSPYLLELSSSPQPTQ